MSLQILRDREIRAEGFFFRKRIALMSRYITTNDKSVIELGKGAGSLKKLLPPAAAYCPVDNEWFIACFEKASPAALEKLYACTGCEACVNICPADCCRLEPDKDGFIRPRIEHQKCLVCGKCVGVCPISSYKKQTAIPSNTHTIYRVIHYVVKLNSDPSSKVAA